MLFPGAGQSAAVPADEAGARLSAVAPAAAQAARPPAPRQMSWREWVVVGLLVMSVVINYIDRSDLSMAAPVIQKQFALSPVQLGSLLAAFFWTYSLLQITGVVGWLADRFPAGWVILWGYLLWSLATVATGLTAGFASLFVWRLLLGAGESVAYPCYSRIFATMPQQYRGRANALIDAGTKMGPAAGAFVGGLLLVHFGWRMLFVILGAAGLVWMLPWWKTMPRTSAAAREQPVPAAAFIRIFRQSSAWGTFIGHFCGNYFFYFLLAWLPEFAVREEHLSLRAMSRLTTVVFLLIALATLAAGWASDRLIAGGKSPSQVRRAVAAGGLLVASSLMGFALIGHHSREGLGLLLLASAGYGAFSSNHWAITQTLAGPEAAGRWSGFQNGFANLSGIVAPWVAGWIVAINGSARMAFVVAGGVALLGAFCWWVLVPRVEPVPWERLSAGAAAR